MAWVVFLRGANVGGHRTFQPSIFAREMAEFGVMNVGAAGTFVVRGTISQASLRAQCLKRLPFKLELMICPACALLDLAHGDSFEDWRAQKNVQPLVSVLEKPPRTKPRLPLDQPAGSKWEVRIIGVSGRFALSLRRRLGPRAVYPNQVVEKHFGVPATTRGWDTISAICDILER